MGGLGTVSNPTDSHKIAIVSMLIVFSAGFVFAWAPPTYVITTEVSALRLRGASQRTTSIVNVLMNFAVKFSLPYLLYAPYAALGSRVGFIFGAITVCALVFTFFCVPECKGRTLEQVDRMFIEGVSLRHSGDYEIIENSEIAMEKGGLGIEVKAVEKI